MAVDNNSIYYMEDKKMTYIYLYIAGWLFMSWRLGEYHNSRIPKTHNPTIASFKLMLWMLVYWPIMFIGYVIGFISGVLNALLRR